MASATTSATASSGPSEGSLTDYVKSVHSLGFNKLIELAFVGQDGQGEKFFVFFHPKDAIILRFYSDMGTELEKGSFYFNWRRRCTYKDALKLHLPLGGGHWVDKGREVYAGWNWVPDENLRAAIDMLKLHGDFINPWVYGHALNLSHSGDFLPGGRLVKVEGGRYDHAEYQSLLRERLRMIPPDIRTRLLQQRE